LNCSLESKLDLLDLSFTRVGGELPSCLGRMPKMNYLYLNSMQLIGTVPFDVWNHSEMAYLFLNNNPSLSGPIPDVFDNRDKLVELRLGIHVGLLLLEGCNFTCPYPKSLLCFCRTKASDH
jgi:hypothetical protein